MDTDILAKKIINDLNNNLNSSISEFDIIPVTDQQLNKSPVIVIGDKLGLESWCIEHVYKYSHRQFILWKLSKRDNDFKSIQERDVVHLSNVILLINPAYRCVWNFRRSLIESNCTSIASDLKFCELILSRKPRSPEVFSYRQFLLQKLLPNIPLDVVQKELELTLQSSSKYFRNYYSWSHRIWLITILRRQNDGTLNYNLKGNNTHFRLFVEEIETVKKFIKSHVSDFSGYHYIQVIIQILHTSGNVGSNLLEVIEDQFRFIDELFPFYPDLESIFLHRRFLLKTVDKYHSIALQNFMEKEITFLSTYNRNSRSVDYLMEKHKIWLEKSGYSSHSSFPGTSQ